MRVPLSWLREYVDLPADIDVKELADRLTLLGLKLEALESPGADVDGPLVVGRVLTFDAEEHSNGKTIRWCQVDVGEGEPRGIVCGAPNFAVGDLVVVALPGAVLPGGFAIAARKTYGHVSDGMICSAASSASATTTPASSCSRPAPAAVGDDAVGCWTCATTCSTSRSTPTGATRCRCAASPARPRRPTACRSATRRSTLPAAAGR